MYEDLYINLFDEADDLEVTKTAVKFQCYCVISKALLEYRSSDSFKEHAHSKLQSLFADDVINEMIGDTHEAMRDLCVSEES